MTLNLLEALTVASSVVIDKHSIVSLRYAWLGKQRITASNGAVTAVLRCDTPFRGGVDSKLFLGLIKGDDTTFEGGGEEVLVKRGRSRTRVPLIQVADSLKIAPSLLTEEPHIKVSDLDPDILKVLIGLDMKGIMPDQEIGTLVILPGEGKLTFYITNRSSINRHQSKADWIEDVLPSQKRYSVGLDFMVTLLKFWPVFSDGLMYFSEDSIYVISEAGHALHARAIRVTSKLDFRNAMATVWLDRIINTDLLVPIPDELQDALKRAATIRPPNDDVTFEVYRDVVTIKAASPAASFEESFTISGDLESATVRLSLSRLLRVVNHVGRMYISNTGIALYGPGKFCCHLSVKRG